MEIVGNTFYNAGGNNSYAVQDNGSTIANISGNSFSAWNLPIYFTQPGNKVVAGNTSVGSGTDASNSMVNGPYAYLAVQSGNSWDKGPQQEHLYAASGQVDQINCDGAAATIGCQFIGKGTALHRFFVNTSQQVLQVGTDGAGANSAILSGGSGATLSSSAGNTNITSAGSVAINKIIACSVAPSGAGYLCNNNGTVTIKP